MDVSDILKKKKWAVVGASDDDSKFGCKIYKKLKSLDYDVCPVNPGKDSVLGDKCYKSVSDMPEKPDVVNVVVPPKVAVGVMQDIKDAGVENVWLQPGVNKPEVIKKAKELGLNVIDDCVLVRAGR